MHENEHADLLNMKEIKIFKFFFTIDLTPSTDLDKYENLPNSMKIFKFQLLFDGFSLWRKF